MDQIKLTQYSHGAGCGCKISPAVLDKILQSEFKQKTFSPLLVGNESRDDAAVFDLGNGECVISTTDFFMPIVDDPFTFGAIASVNAISDVYAMGGDPLMAIAILGWPISKLSPEVAGSVLEGSRHVCSQAGIPLAGGHSIDCPEPVFGLAVTGTVKKKHLKRNNTAAPGSLLYLTKPLGVGIIMTAQKKGLVEEKHLKQAIETMLTLNTLGSTLGKLPYVKALTDVTGFGLLGHLSEVCQGSGLSAEIEFAKVPQFDFLDSYISEKCIPGGTMRNWESYGSRVAPISDFQKAVLADPQTSGGLLIAVEEAQAEAFEKVLHDHNHSLKPFGQLGTKQSVLITVK